jgi:CDP-diacylglycerol---serine O-phosphatidyltransferase
MNSPNGPKIYLLPNLMTAGNLFCGFAATLRILDGTIMRANEVGGINRFREAILFILAACIFDLLDGRLARLGGNESPFGREFDSLADVVSFGIAPALLVHEVVLLDFPERWALVISFIYLCCGAMRLARFNCIAADPDPEASKSFKGLPIPAAAGVIASLTLFMLWLEEGEKTIGKWRYGLPILMLFLSWMMFSQFKYPSFKVINWRAQRGVWAFLLTFLLLIFTGLNYQWMPFVLFMSYLLYGFLRPWLSRSWRREIEETIDDEVDLSDDDEANGNSKPANPPPPSIP